MQTKYSIICHMIKSINELDGFFNSYNPSLGSGKLRENRLDRMRILLSELGNPELSYKTIHIAGSKGKGTTAIYLSKIMHAPDFRERFDGYCVLWAYLLGYGNLHDAYVLVFPMPEDIARLVIVGKIIHIQYL